MRYLSCFFCRFCRLHLRKSEKFIRWISNIENGVGSCLLRLLCVHLCILDLSLSHSLASLRWNVRKEVSRRSRLSYCWISNCHFDINVQTKFNFFILFLYFHRHPLFSLLALLLEKCEQATQGYVPSASSSNSSSASSPNGSTNNNENDSFSRDIQVSCLDFQCSTLST